MEEKKASGSKLKKQTNTELHKSQFDHFWEIICPSCGEMIDLEILINLMKRRLKDE